MVKKKKVKLNRDIEKPHPEKDKPKDTIMAPTKFQPKFTGLPSLFGKPVVGAIVEVPSLGKKSIFG